MKDVNYNIYGQDVGIKTKALMMILLFAWAIFFWPFTLVMALFYRKELNQIVKELLNNLN